MSQRHRYVSDELTRFVARNLPSDEERFEVFCLPRAYSKRFRTECPEVKLV